jgi:glycosyltransferase involved in cell wall biosynthesis
LKAFHLLRADGAVRHKLVLAGKRGWKDRAIFREIRRRGLESEVVCTGYVPSDMLAALYSLSDLFVLPSLWEGFGFPALEAMACGTPVLVSDVSSLTEVVGDAGLRAPPDDPARMALAMREALGNQRLRDDLGRKGVERARAFTWDRACAETEAVYEEAGGGAGGGAASGVSGRAAAGPAGRGA